MKYYGFKSIAKFPRSNLKNLGFANGMAQVIKSLFTNNEQGFAFDFNDLSTMYQDAAGITPVTGVGQPVGLVLDKSKGLMLSNDLTDITKQLGNTPTASITYDGEWWNIVSTASSIAFLGISQRSLNPGTYRINFSFKRRPENPRITIDTGIGQFTLYANDLNGNYSLTIQVTSSFSIFFRDVPVNSGNAGSFKIDSIHRLDGNHATQTTSAKRPILQQNTTTGAYYLAFDGVDDLLSTASFPAMGLGTTLFAGTECNKTGTTVIAGRSASGYFYQTNAVIGVQGSNPTYVSVSGKTVATAIYSDNGNDVTIRANKLTNTQPNTARGFNNTIALTIGSLNTTGTLFYQGNIYSLIGINRVAPTTEITNTENAIAKNVGVTL